jgi:hypothetical protein
MNSTPGKPGIMRSLLSRMSRTTFTLLLANIGVIVLAVFNNWSLSEMLWIYWGQSVIIGIFNFLRLRKAVSLKNAGGKLAFLPFFFAIHYGLFHFVYMVFINVDYSEGGIGGAYLLASLSLFFLTAFYSYMKGRKQITEATNPALLMFFPYIRILPMHLVLLVGSLVPAGATVFFLVLKTLSDAAMQMVEENRAEIESLAHSFRK